MKAGSLDHVVLIERRTETISDDGAVTDAWSLHATLRAAVQAATSDQAGEPGRLTTTLTLTTRYLDDLDTGRDRLVLDGVAYALRGVQPIGRRRGLTITADRRVG